VEPTQRRAIRNGLLAEATTAALLLIVDALGPNEGQPETSPTQPTSTPPPGCTARWRPVRSLNPDPAGSELHAVVAVSNKEAWAVGAAGPPDAPTSSLVERWDGHQWILVATPNDGAVNVLNGIAVGRPKDAWAVGRTSRGAQDLPLIEHWDGTAWSLSAAPSVPGGTILYGVAAAGPTAWAVGASGSAELATEQALILTWDGTAWTTDTIPPLPGPTVLLGAMATSPRQVWAVGSQRGRPLVLRFNGTSWRRVEAPGRGGLAAIAPLGRNVAWAVGSSIERWTGSRWIVVGRAGTSEDLSGIASLSPQDVWAVGSSRGGGRRVVRPLVQRFDGTTWKPVAGSFLPHGVLLGTDSAPDGTVWSVGYQDRAARRRAIIVRGSVTCA